MVGNNYLEFITTPFCGVCQSVRPMIEILAASLELSIVEINANHHESYLQEHHIRQVPAIIVRNESDILYVTDVIDNMTNLYNEIIKKIS